MKKSNKSVTVSVALKNDGCCRFLAREVASVDIEEARALMAECLVLGAAANRAAEVGMRLSDQTEREAVLRCIGSINDLVYADLMRPIIKTHPELDPDR